MRLVVFHHHLFKNAGTSVDAALQRAFGEGWTPLEATQGELLAADLLETLRQRPGIRAVSSHTYRFPLPQAEGIRVFPVVFIRHPLDRARSAYEFERRQDADTEGARLAKSHDFAGYVRARLGTPGDRSLANFQAMKLSARRAPRDATATEEFLSALDTLCALPFVGLVEDFAHAMRVLSRQLGTLLGPLELEVAAQNVTRGLERTLPARVAAAEAELGGGLTAAFYAANQFDLRLYRIVRRLQLGAGEA